MDKEKLRDVIYILVAIILSILAVKLVIWLLPIIIIVLLAHFIYKELKKNKRNEGWERATTEKTNIKKSKRIIIDEEKND